MLPSGEERYHGDLGHGQPLRLRTLKNGEKKERIGPKRVKSSGSDGSLASVRSRAEWVDIQEDLIFGY
jgi:hypothetical protein